MPRGTQDHRRESGPLSRTGLSPSLVRLSSTVLLAARFLTPRKFHRTPWRVLQPLRCNDCGLDTTQVWAVPLSLATTQGIISFPRGTKMFQFPRFPPTSLFCSAGGTQAFPWVGFPIRVSSDQRLHTATRGLSQCTTPFFGSWRQDIHRTPLVA